MRRAKNTDDKLPTLGSVAESGAGLTVWCNDDACSYLREHGYRHQVIYTTEKLAAFAQAYAPASSLSTG